MRCRCVKRVTEWGPTPGIEKKNKTDWATTRLLQFCIVIPLPWENAIHSQSPTLSTYYMCHFRVTLKCFHTSDWIPHEQPSLFEWNDINVYTVIKMQKEEIKNKRSWGENRVQSGWIMDLWWCLPLHPGGFTQCPGGMVSYGARGVSPVFDV